MDSPRKSPEIRLAAQGTYRPLTYINIHKRSDISWSRTSSQNASQKPFLVRPYKERHRNISGIGTQQVSAVQHIPPTHQRRHTENYSIMPEVSNHSDLVSSTSEYTNILELPSERGHYREDVDLDDQTLVTISTKELNRILKKKNISKTRSDQIKSQRRTLKNRGYASTCRHSREDEEKQLEKDILELDEKIKSKPPEEILKAEHDQLKEQIIFLQKELGISDDSCDVEVLPDDSKEEMKDDDDFEVEMKIEIEEESLDDYTSSDNGNE